MARIIGGITTSHIPAIGAMTRGASIVHSHCHIPVSNTAAGVLVLENTAGELVGAASLYGAAETARTRAGPAAPSS